MAGEGFIVPVRARNTYWTAWWWYPAETAAQAREQAQVQAEQLPMLLGAEKADEVFEVGEPTRAVDQMGDARSA